jgi:hypothetical protein
LRQTKRGEGGIELRPPAGDQLSQRFDAGLEITGAGSIAAFSAAIVRRASIDRLIA